MDKLNNAPCFQPARILLPAEGTPLNPWACIAVDQFTSQPEYWQQAEALAAGHPSTLHIVLPEAYLGQPGEEERLAQIRAAMADYRSRLLTRVVNGFVYLERTQQDGSIRQGLVGMVDLEAYSFDPGGAPRHPPQREHGGVPHPAPAESPPRRPAGDPPRDAAGRRRGLHPHRADWSGPGPAAAALRRRADAGRRSSAGLGGGIPRADCADRGRRRRTGGCAGLRRPLARSRWTAAHDAGGGGRQPFAGHRQGLLGGAPRRPDPPAAGNRPRPLLPGGGLQHPFSRHPD